MTDASGAAQRGAHGARSSSSKCSVSSWHVRCLRPRPMLPAKSFLASASAALAFVAVLLVAPNDAHATDAGCVAAGASCALGDTCCNPGTLSCDSFGDDAGTTCGFLGCRVNGADCTPVTQLGQMDSCCSGHCSAITYTCLAPDDPGPACVPSGDPCTSKGGQCCNIDEVCDYHASPTMMTCGARPPPVGDCAGDCDGGGASSSGGGASSSGGGTSSGSIFPPASSSSSPSSGGSSSSSGCACDVTGGGRPAWPAAGLAAVGLTVLLARGRRRRSTRR